MHEPLLAGQPRPQVLSPGEYFDSLTVAEQDRLFGKGPAQAIRDGTPMNRAVNANRGMWRAAAPSSRNVYEPRRPAVASVLAQARGDRIEAVRLLREQGYFAEHPSPRRGASVTAAGTRTPSPGAGQPATAPGRSGSGGGGTGTTPPATTSGASGSRPLLPGRRVTVEELSALAGEPYPPRVRNPPAVPSAAPTLADLERRGMLRQDSDLEGLDPEERRSVEWFEAASSVRWRRVSTDSDPTPDLWLPDHGTTLELKCPGSTRPSRWARRWAKAARQSEHLLVDGRGLLDAGVPPATVIRLFTQKVGSHGLAFREALLVLGDTVEDGLLWVRG